MMNGQVNRPETKCWTEVDEVHLANGLGIHVKTNAIDPRVVHVVDEVIVERSDRRQFQMECRTGHAGENAQNVRTEIDGMVAR